MYFPDEETTKIVFAFSALPETPEMKEIGNKYVNDEIGVMEFASLAKEYMDSHSLPTKGGE